MIKMNHKSSIQIYVSYILLLLCICIFTAIEGFHVTSYQANFASRHTCDRHVGFPLA